MHCFGARNCVAEWISRSLQLTTLWQAFTDQSVLPGSLRFGGAKYMLIAGDPGSVIRGKLSQVSLLLVASS